MLVDTWTYLHTSNTNNAGVRDVRFMLPKFRCKVYTDSYCSGKSMMTVFPLLYKFKNMPFGYNKSKLQDIYTLNINLGVCVQMSVA